MKAVARGLLCMVVALVGAPIARAAQWAAPVSTAVPRDAIATVVDDAAGIPHVVTVVPPSGFVATRKGAYNQDQHAEDVNARGDFVGIVASPPRVGLYYRAAGGTTHRTSPPNPVAKPTDFLNGDGVSVTIDPDGNAVAAWYHPDGRLTIATHLAQAASWDPPTTLSATAPGEAKTLGALDRPTVVAGPSGSVTVVWQDYYSLASHDNIRDFFAGLRTRLRSTTRASVTAGWSPTQTIRTTATSFGSLRVALGPTGTGVAIWGEAAALGGQGGALRSASIAADGAWSIDPDPLGETPDVLVAEIALAVGVDGTAVLVGPSLELTSPAIAGDAPLVVRRRPVGGQWGPPEMLRGVTPAQSSISAVEDIDVSPAGHAVVLASRSPGDFFRPSGSNLGSTLVASVAPPGGPFSALTDLHPPTTRTHVRSSAGVDASGTVTVGVQTAPRQFDTRPTGPDRFSLIQYSDTAVPAPPLPAAHISDAHGPPRVLDAGALGWIHLTLTRPVEDVPVVVTERRGGRDRVVARWSVSGTRPFVPVRMTRGRHVFRVQPDGVIVAGVSQSVTMTARRAPHRMIQIPPGQALEDYTIYGSQMWVLSTVAQGTIGTLQRYDTLTARRRGAPVLLDWRALHREGILRLAAGRGTVWVVDRATATPIDTRLGRVGTTLSLGLSAEGFTQAAVVDEKSRVWVIANDRDLFRSSLLEVDASTGVRRRILMAKGPSETVNPTLTTAGHSLVLREEAGGDPDGPSFRIDTRSGRVTAIPGWSIAGNGQQWQLTARTLRRLTSPPLTIPIPRTPAGQTHRFWGLATAPNGLWLRWATAPEDDFSTPVPLRFVSGRTGRVGPPITVTLPSGAAPGDADDQLLSEPFVAGPGGAWLPFVSDGVLVQVPAL